MTSKIKEYEIYINYHTKEQCSYKVLATDQSTAEEIAKMMFNKNYANWYVFDSIAKPQGQESDSVIITNKTMMLDVKSMPEPKDDWYAHEKKFGSDGTDKIWRWPTREELRFILDNEDKIPNLDMDVYYWSSTEFYNLYSYVDAVNDGLQPFSTKYAEYPVRCVRR